MIFKMKYMRSSGRGHVYCRLFSAPGEGQTFAALGNLTVRTAEFEDMRAAMPGVVFEEEPLDRHAAPPEGAQS